MKSVEEFVKTVSEEKKNEIVKSYYTRLTKGEVIRTLFDIDLATKAYGNNDPQREPVLNGYLETYNLKKSRAQEWDLWDTQYDEHLKFALKGELNREELLKTIKGAEEK